MDNEKKVYDFIKGNLINLIVILLSCIYIFYGMVNIQAEKISIWESIVKSLFGVVVGFIIKQCLGENGFNKGYSSSLWNEQLIKYSNACNLVNDYIDKVDNFYIAEEIEKKRDYRMNNLLSARMKYSLYFNKDGEFIGKDEDIKKLSKHQKKVLNKCIDVKIYNLNLFSEYANTIDSYTHKEKTDKMQRGSMATKNTITLILTSVIGVYFVATWNGWDWGEFIVSCIQVCGWVATGVIQLYTNYNYVVIEKVNKLKKKIELIAKFKKGYENGLYQTNPYLELGEENG